MQQEGFAFSVRDIDGKKFVLIFPKGKEFLDGWVVLVDEL